MSSVPTHIKIQDEFNEIKSKSIENVNVEKSKYNVWNLTFIVEGKLKKLRKKLTSPFFPPRSPGRPPHKIKGERVVNSFQKNRFFGFKKWIKNGFLPKIAKNGIFIKNFNFLAKITLKNRSFRGSTLEESLFFWLWCEGGCLPSIYLWERDD